jgi:hypothetical protein
MLDGQSVPNSGKREVQEKDSGCAEEAEGAGEGPFAPPITTVLRRLARLVWE